MKKILILILFLLPLTSYAGWKDELTTALKNGGAYVLDENGKVLYEHRSGEKFIVASTMKLATAALALKVLGPDHHFSTPFYLNSNHDLIVKGAGDPSLTSEDLAQIASDLKERVGKVHDIILDTSFFEPNIVIHGSSSTTNPYDAINGALLVNFNTVNIKKSKTGVIESAEPQTPITPIAIAAGKNLKAGKSDRINLGKDPIRSAKYAGELLTAFLTKEGVAPTGTIKLGQAPDNTNPVYSYRSPKSLEDILKSLLEYSTNFMANQIFLVCGSQVEGGVATMEKAKRVLNNFLKTEVGLSDFVAEEGSGLSRFNQFTPREMVKLVSYLKPYHDLFPLKDHVFHAKTGTLSGVSTFAGFVDLGNREARFALFVNDDVGGHYKYQVAKLMYQGLMGQ
ncbi:D-alanyl-D-alanine carboxypeptidase [bacterium]|nr:D-alanyl-D-alanine carboxypeptidase [bacterium]